MILLTLLACPRSPEIAEVEPPTVGWRMEEGWSGACFVAPDFETIDPELRPKLEQDTVEALVAQWQGRRRDGVGFDQDLAAETGDMLLVLRERLPEVAQQNLALCIEVMAEGVTTATWGRWLQELNEDLAEELCPEPLEDTYLTLDVSEAWFAEIPLCAGQRYVVSGSGSDRYRVAEDGPFVTVVGEGSGEGLPCPECPAGMLIARFDGDSGSEAVFGVGARFEGVAPEDGTLWLGLNDRDPSDNAYLVEEGVRDSVSVQVSPKR